MIDYKHLELLHAELDGLNSPQASAKLSAYLAANPEAQKLYDALRSTANLLAEVKPIAPPPHLQFDIMHALPQRAPVRATASGIFVDLKNWWREIFAGRPAISFAAGLAMGVLLFALALQLPSAHRESDAAKLYGTIGAPASNEPAEAINSHRVQNEQAEGEVKWYYVNAHCVVEFLLTGAEPFELVFSFAPSALRCEEISAMAGEALPPVTSQAGQVQFAQASKHAYRVSFAGPNGAEAHLALQRNGRAFHEATILLGSH